MRRRWLGNVALVAFALAPQAAAGGTTWLVPPVDAAVVREFEPPSFAWGRGHRGIDYQVPAGTAVRAAGAGRVSFAGRVPDGKAVSIDHGQGLTTTYSSLSEVYVARGDQVDEGRWIGTVGQSHHGHAGGLHLGVKVEGDYVDPQAYLGPLDAGSGIHLAPLTWAPPPVLEPVFGRAAQVHPRRSSANRCEPVRVLRSRPVPPSDNVAVAIAGIASKTRGGVSAAIYENGPESLGYHRDDVYRFSYRGPRGARLHQGYERVDTYRDLRESALLLRSLLVRLAARRPGRNVDLIAHSQGGIVARTFLELSARSYDPRLPVIEHLVTFATPHGGAPLAALPRELEKQTVTGRFVREGLSRWSRNGGPIPDPASAAVAQLAPGSDLLRRLAREDVLYGTRVLALAIPHDLLVPADRALYAGKESRLVPVEGLNGHEAITSSLAARSIAYAFLRNAAPSCTSGVDEWGPQVGRAIGWLEGKVPWAYSQAEDRLGGRIVRGAGRVLRGAGRAVGRIFK